MREGQSRPDYVDPLLTVLSPMAPCDIKRDQSIPSFSIFLPGEIRKEKWPLFFFHFRKIAGHEVSISFQEQRNAHLPDAGFID